MRNTPLGATATAPDDSLPVSVRRALENLDQDFEDLGHSVGFETRYLDKSKVNGFRRRLKHLKEFQASYDPWTPQELELRELVESLNRYTENWAKAPRRAALTLACELTAQHDDLVRRFGKSPNLSTMIEQLDWIRREVRRSLVTLGEVLPVLCARFVDETTQRSAPTVDSVWSKLVHCEKVLKTSEGTACESLAETLRRFRWGHGDTAALLIEAEQKLAAIQEDLEFDRIPGIGPVM